VLPTGVPTVLCPNAEALLIPKSMAFEEEDDVDGPCPKAVGVTEGAFWRMGTVVEKGVEIMGIEVATGSMKGSGLSTTNVEASWRIRDFLLKK
jgi:hypothetical protein